MFASTLSFRKEFQLFAKYIGNISSPNYGKIRTFKIMANCVQRALKVFHDTYSDNGWVLCREPLSERVNVQNDRRFGSTNVEYRECDTNVLNTLIGIDRVCLDIATL